VKETFAWTPTMDANLGSGTATSGSADVDNSWHLIYEAEPPGGGRVTQRRSVARVENSGREVAFDARGEVTDGVNPRENPVKVAVGDPAGDEWSADP
jgi:hypothetical protein